MAVAATVSTGRFLRGVGALAGGWWPSGTGGERWLCDCGGLPSRGAGLGAWAGLLPLLWPCAWRRGTALA